MIRRAAVVASAICVALAGCGGSGGGASSAPPRPQQPLGSERLVISIPLTSRSAHGRTPRYISTATNSLSVVAPGIAPMTQTLTPSSPGCKQTTSALVCTVEFPLPLGNNTITLSTFASMDGSGTPLSIATIAVTVVSGQANMFSVTLNGVVSSLSVVDPAVPPGTMPQVATGKPSTHDLIVNALDAAGQVIVGPGSYSDASGNPVTITLSDSDATGATSVSPATITAPSNSSAATVTYNGAPIPNFTITASAPGVASVSMTYQVNSSPQVVNVGTYGCGPSGSGSRAISSVAEYAAPSSGTTVGAFLGSVTVKGDTADAIAVTRAGDVFLLAFRTVYHFAPGASGSTPPVGSFSISPEFGSAIAADSAGGVWVAGIDQNTAAGELLHYPPGANGTVAPDRAVTGVAGLPPSLTFDGGTVAVDSKDNVYTVAEQVQGTQARVYVLPPSANGSAVTPTGSYPFDKAANQTGKVSIDQHTDTVWEYPANIYAGGSAVAPAPGATPIADTGFIAYSSGSATPSRVLYTNMPYPISLAADDRGNVYVINSPLSPSPCSDAANLTVYTPTDSGFVSARAQLQNLPFAVAIAPLSVPARSPSGSGSPNGMRR